jgi:predicted nucleotidyltransferase
MTGTRWWYPDAGLEPQHIACAHEFLDGVPYRDRVVAALVSGSRAAGLAHGRSDLDVIIVVATDEDRSRCRTLPTRHQDLTVDSETVTVADVQRVLDAQKARETAKVLDRRLYRLADYPGWMALVRLATAHLLVATTPSVRTLVASVERGAVRRSLMVHGALCLATFAEDVKGAVECGDRATALAAAEEAVRCGLDISLAALDDVYIGRKYLPRRMARHRSLAYLLERDDLFGQPCAQSGDDEIGRIIRRRLLLAGHLAGQSMAGGWHRPVRTVTPFVPGEAGPVRDPYLTPVRWPAGLGLMIGVDVVRQVSKEEVVLWNLLDGRPFGAVKNEFARLNHRAAADVDLIVRRTVEDWRSAGLVHDPR